jgi:hypothetical protein
MFFFSSSVSTLAWLSIVTPNRGPDMSTVSVTPRGRAFDWLTVHEPIGRAGYSILIYRFP